MIDQPGVYDLPVDQYHADPVVEISLSSSGLKRLIEQSPSHFAAYNPRLSPDMVQKRGTSEQDLGTVVHRILLEAGKPFQVLDFDDFKSGAAQKARALAHVDGQVAILRRVHDRALTIAAKAREQLVVEFGTWPIGFSEQTMIWRRQTDEDVVWCRALSDHLAFSKALQVDLKTTGLQLSDDKITKKIVDERLDVQAAHYIEGMEILAPELRGRARFLFVIVETEAPFEVRFFEIPEHILSYTRPLIDNAAHKFAQCLRTDTWPGRPRYAQIELPTWAAKRWEAELLQETA